MQIFHLAVFNVLRMSMLISAQNPLRLPVPFLAFVPEYTDRPDSLEAKQAPTLVFNTHYLIKVPKGLVSDPAYHNTSVELGSQQPRLLVGRGRHRSVTKHSQWDAIRKRSFGLFLVTDCGG